MTGEWDNDHARRGGRAAAGSKRKNSARAQQLAEGGTPIDFTFGIGPDGEVSICDLSFPTAPSHPPLSF